MFDPKFTITYKLLDTIKEIESLRVKLEHKYFSDLILLSLEKEAKVRSVYASTSIEGNSLSLTQVKDILKKSPSNINDTQLEVSNYNKALEFLNKSITSFLDVDSLVDDEKPLEYSNLSFKKVPISSFRDFLNEKKILDTWGIVMKDLPKGDNLGFRKGTVLVNNPKTGDVIYLPPAQKEVPALMQELLDFVYKNTDVIDPIILAGIFHRYFVIVHPFIDGNGRVARLMTKYLLAGLGINTFNHFSLESYYNDNVSTYFSSVGVFGNYYDLKGSFDYTEWLEYFSEGILFEFKVVYEKLRTKQDIPENRLRDFHYSLLEYVLEHGYIADSDYEKLTDRAKSTRALDFKKLVDFGVLEMRGKGKNTYYVLADRYSF